MNFLLSNGLNVWLNINLILTKYYEKNFSIYHYINNKLLFSIDMDRH